MVRTSTMMAGLALAITTYASPLPQSEDLVLPAETPTVDDTLPTTDPQVDAGAESGTTGLPEAISLGEAIESSQEDAQKSACSLDPQDAKSWADSGAEQMVIDYLKANGPGNYG